MKELRVAIIGCGAIAKKRHAPAVKQTEHVQLVGVFDVQQASADALAEKYETTAYSDLDLMLHEAKPDCVCVCTPAKTHAEISIRCMQAGMDVLCEKPMATNVADALRMMETSRETGRRLMICFSNRAYSEHRTMKRLIKEGRIGNPFMFKTSLEDPGVENLIGCEAGPFYDRIAAAASGGVMVGMGCHRVDLIRYFFDSAISEVCSMYANLDKRNSEGEPPCVEDTAIALIRLQNGVAGTLSTSWCNYGPGELGTEIYGTKGLLRYRGDEKVELWKGDRVETFLCPKDLAEKNGYGIVQNFLRTELGIEEPITVVEDGVACMKVLDALESSALTRSWCGVAE